VGSFTSVVDGWGVGFVDELNYGSEAANSERFRASMAERGFDGSITAPVVFKVRPSRVKRCTHMPRLF
jgi:predicted unusual protein kinase regulating ubiquinone biosynthesis (AarF/ABC1/UbiB family)